MKLHITVDNVQDIENADDAACKEILLDHVLNMVDNPVVLLQQVVKKMRHGCKLIITCADIYTICEAYVIAEINSSQLTDLLVGSKRHFAIEDVCSMLTELGIKITKKRLDGFEMIIEGERP